MSGPPRAWVSVIPPEQAAGALAEAYASVAGPDGEVENLYLAMGHVPGVIAPADAQYRALLHDPAGPLVPWQAEAIATWVAMLCGCRYAVANHGQNLRDLMGDPERAEALLAAMEAGRPEEATEGPMAAALAFARKLSERPAEMAEADVAALRAAGHDDRAISWIVQIVASFAYWSRAINGLGIRLGDRVGLSGAPRPPE